MPDTILKYPDCLFYLPVGLTVANGDVMMDDAKPFTEPCKTAHKLGTIVSLDIAWLTPMGNQVIMQELGYPSTMQ